jgi:hypothetical protein
MDAMDWIDLVQLKIDKKTTNIKTKSSRNISNILKERNKKTH